MESIIKKTVVVTITVIATIIIIIGIGMFFMQSTYSGYSHKYQKPDYIPDSGNVLYEPKYK